MKKIIFIILILTLVLGMKAISAEATNQAPVADAGLSRYAGVDAVILDGTGSFDPDDSGSLLYAWQQTAGPSVVITDSNTATPTISGFVQTDEIQECEFELVVWDGELTSLPDSVKVFIVPDFGIDTLRLENPPFDPNKPTFIYFGGGDCITGSGGWSTSDWSEKANVISFTSYGPDSSGGMPTYYNCGDMIVVYLSSVASDYKQPIQTSGWSTGGPPAVDAGIRLNLTYADARYAVNRVTFLDVTCRTNYGENIATFLRSSVDGEQCWIDNYASSKLRNPPFNENVLNVGFRDATGHQLFIHELPPSWYRLGIRYSDRNDFNHGVVAGVYWSVVGPGKNLQLASTPDEQTYKFSWYGNAFSGHMDFYDEPNHPGRLPEPVTLVGPEDGFYVDADGAVFSCEVSENAIGYQLLFGPDPYRVMDYYIISDTPEPPSEAIASSPFDPTWWTIRVYDQYGSTIYADPFRVNFEKLDPLPIENINTGQGYGSIHRAINEARRGDEIVIRPGVYHESIDFKGKNLTLRSMDPNDPSVVVATVINGGHLYSVVTFSGGEDSSCVLDGLTITGGIIGISCRDASPTIRNCTIGSPGRTAIEFWNFRPKIINCTILGNVIELLAALGAYWRLDEETGNIAHDSLGVHNGTAHREPSWQPAGGKVGGALLFDGIDDYISTDFILDPSSGAFSVFAWVFGGAPGQVIMSQTDGVGTGNTWLGLDDSNGNVMTGLVPPRAGWINPRPLVSESFITDNQWHHVGLVWDGSYRALYVDGIEVAKDTSTLTQPLVSSTGGLYIGSGKNADTGPFFSGLIDDVRIYNRTLSAEEIMALIQ